MGDTYGRCVSCTNLCNCKASLIEPRVHTFSSPAYSPPCRKIEGAAALLFQSIATAFFTSLQWCACFRIDTKDEPDDSDYYSSLICINDGLEEDGGVGSPGRCVYLPKTKANFCNSATKLIDGSGIKLNNFCNHSFLHEQIR
ncbi:hypothetical protein FH972_004384 [Carpinus fangiana]|uniref:Uncharacterized protein n=1 Tax=Carpinus fangiana TaxID=176857 RepID=A0A5N6QKZ0_9ROSI|nr:hypothetical protein FH972_004384 [Carpinus fangiana]